MSKLISLTTDFGVQSQSIGVMEAVIYNIAPESRVIHLMHGISSFNIIAAARTLESIQFMPIGIHICVCDPGVGTSRKCIIIQTNRGDFLIGPDNGVLIPGSQLLEGINLVHEITNKKYMRLPISPIFHGRDIFSPAAAHLSNGIDISEFGPRLNIESLMSPPYVEAEMNTFFITSTVIQINRFGSLHLNISHSFWDTINFPLLALIEVQLKNNEILKIRYVEKFQDVPFQENLILKDDYGRICISKNMGSFAETYNIKIGMQIKIFFMEKTN